MPPLKEVKVKVLPERLPGAAVRPAVKLVAVPVLPVRPSADSALPVPMIVRSAVVPVEICSAPLELIEELVWPEAVATVAAPLALVAVWTPVARSMAVSTSAMRRRLQIDRRVAAAVGDDVAADAGAGRQPLAAPGVGAFLNVMVLPFTFSVEPSWIRLPSVARWSCGPRRPW